ncbi:hypothetical protein STANM309S_00606 [Streptomyces tanashiensis]
MSDDLQVFGDALRADAPQRAGEPSGEDRSDGDGLAVPQREVGGPLQRVSERVAVVEDVTQARVALVGGDHLGLSGHTGGDLLVQRQPRRSPRR